MRSQKQMWFKTFTVFLALIICLSISFGCRSGATAVNEHPKMSVDSESIGSPIVEAATVVSPDCVELQKLIDKTYDFKPSKLSAAQRTAKSGEMDIFWEKVKADQKHLSPCLISALQSKEANSFFRFDGSTLLYSFDKSESSKKLLVESYSKSEIEDVDPRNWIAYILKLGLEGLDISAAGDTWLRAKDPRFYLPEHGALAVDKKSGALAIFGSMEEQFATPSLISIAKQVDHPGRLIAVDVLTKIVTDEAFDGLSKLDTAGFPESSRLEIRKVLFNPTFIEKRVGPPKISRAQYLKAFNDLVVGDTSTFMNLTFEVRDGEKDAVAVLQKEDINLIRKVRRIFASASTPHSAEWYQSFTDILMFMLRKEQGTK